MLCLAADDGDNDITIKKEKKERNIKLILHILSQQFRSP